MRVLWTLAVASLVGGIFLAGCGPCGVPCPPEDPKPAKTPPPPPPAPDCGTAEMQKVVSYLPGGDDDCATVKVEKAAPKQVQVGQTFEYHIRVQNVSDATLKDVTVWDEAPPQMKATSAEPEVTRIEDPWHIWELGDLKPDESRLIKITGVATGVAELHPCAEVTYRMEPVCLAINVVQPALKLVKTAPEQVLVCDTIPITLTVTNTGSGQACDVVVKDPLPKGLTTMGGETTLTFPVGNLNAGQSRTFKQTLKAADTGTYVNQAVAEARGGLRAQARTTTLVTKPDLSVAKTGPRMRYVGRPVTYDITVQNGPEAIAEQTVLTDTLPAGATFVSASDGGQRQGNKVIWNLGTLQPRDARKVSVTVKAARPMTLENEVHVAATCGQARDTATTEIEGIPAILLEVVDLQDPIEVGSNVTYEIRVTNQGSKIGTGITVTCVLPNELAHVEAMGPTKATVDGQTVTFAPLRALDPGAMRTYRVTAKATGTGDVRFHTSLNSDQMTTPAEETEATRLYE